MGRPVSYLIQAEWQPLDPCHPCETLKRCGRERRAGALPGAIAYVWLPLAGIPKRFAMSGDNPIGDGDDLGTAGIECLLLPRDGIRFRGHIIEPPEMGEHVGAFGGLHHQRRFDS